MNTDVTTISTTFLHQPLSALVSARARGPVFSGSFLLARVFGGYRVGTRTTMDTTHALRNGLPDPTELRVGDSGNDTSSSPEIFKSDSSRPDATEAPSAATTTTSAPAPKLTNVSMSHFHVLDEIGEGSFSEVLLVRRKTSDGASDGKLVALKVMQKKHILREKKGEFVRDERKALDLLRDFDNIVNLQWTFQDNDCIYLGLEHLPGGELFDRIQNSEREVDVEFNDPKSSESLSCKRTVKVKGLSLSATRDVAAALLDAVDTCHANGVVHRDLKPENVLFDGNGKLKLCDFGSCLLLGDGDEEDENDELLPLPDRKKTKSLRQRQLQFVGTCDYVPPEILGEPGGGEAGWAEDLGKQAPNAKALDWWSYGCVLFQCVCGVPPFRGANEFLTYVNVQKGNPARFPDWWLRENKTPETATARGTAAIAEGALNPSEGSLNPFASAFCDLVWKLLTHDPFTRLGSVGGAEEIREHAFFARREKEKE